MSHVTEILSAIEHGDPCAAEELLPIVYDELRKLAAAKIAEEKPGQTLQATALVHEAYLRLVDVDQAQHFNSRGHFFAAAAEAMRRLLVERARRKSRLKRGGELQRVPLDDRWACESNPEEVLAVDDALAKLSSDDPAAAQLVKLRYFADFSIDEAADLLGVSRATAYRNWSYAKAFLRWELHDSDTAAPE